MDDHPIKPFFSTFLIFILLGARTSEGARVFTIINYCQSTVWPALISTNSGDGFVLKSGQSVVLTLPEAWSGRIWGRTGCNFDANGSGQCQTGSCGTSLKCSASGETPATLAEFNLVSLNFYDVSLVDGFNLPITVTPVNGKGNCTAISCVRNLVDNCPSELSFKAGGRTVGCRNACDAFNTDQYCCKGTYASVGTCPPTDYSKLFKQACPLAYSYAFDDAASLFTCSDADYTVSFCGQSQNQRVCTYHINKLVCSRSSRRASSSTQKWLVVLLFCFVSLWSSL